MSQLLPQQQRVLKSQYQTFISYSCYVRAADWLQLSQAQLGSAGLGCTWLHVSSPSEPTQKKQPLSRALCSHDTGQKLKEGRSSSHSDIAIFAYISMTEASYVTKSKVNRDRGVHTASRDMWQKLEKTNNCE